MKKKKQFFAFSVPIEKFFEITNDVGIFWVDLKSRYCGCNDCFAEFVGTTTSNIAGKTDYDFSMNYSQIEALIKNDQSVITDANTKIFVESLDFNAHQGTTTGITLKTPLFDTKKHLAGVFGISLELTGDNLIMLSSMFNEMNVEKLLRQNSQNLTSCETACLSYLVTGKSSKEISKLLFRSPRTIVWHFENIRHKFGCRTIVELLSKIVHKNPE